MGFFKDIFGHFFSLVFSILGFVFVIGAFFWGSNTTYVVLSFIIGLVCFGIAHAFRKRS
jgi:hypothetical protein